MIKIKQNKNFLNLAADKYYKVIFIVDQDTNKLYLVRYNLFGRKISNICPIYKCLADHQYSTPIDKHLGPRVVWPDVQEFLDTICFKKVNYLLDGKNYMAYKDEETGIYYILDAWNSISVKK